MKLDNCPHCNASLIGDPIPEDIREHYSPPYHWRREIGMEYPEKYDGIWEWKCPDCGGTWLSEVALLGQEK
jgi:hypothetical protein